MSDTYILALIKQASLAELVDATLVAAGYQVECLRNPSEAQTLIQKTPFDVFLIEDSTDDEQTFTVIEAVLSQNTDCSVILLSSTSEQAHILRALRAGVADFLGLPLTSDELLSSLHRTLNRKGLRGSKTKSSLKGLEINLDSLWEMGVIGRSLTASLDLNHVLEAVVDAAVKVTGAEEGSLLILDEDSGELVIRAEKNFQDDFVRTFRLPVEDTIAGDVIRKGEPIIINNDAPQKIVTKYLVRSIMYVPLRVRGKVIGVLGVDNRHSSAEFDHEQLSLVSTLADYAAIAIENARLYQRTDEERHKLDSILGQIEDAVIVVSPDYRLVLANRKARMLFNLEDEKIEGQPLEDVFQEEVLIDLFKDAHSEMPFITEITLEEGYVMSAHLVEIPDFGYAVTMQDISYFKELDRVKTEFVNTVSHDLRSPLTAILGYVQLLSKVGEVNTQQQEFIERVQENVRSITELVNSLLELGRIESGLDTFKEDVRLGEIVQQAIKELHYLAEERQQEIVFALSDDLPEIFGDPICLRQVAENLIANAILYTPLKGRIDVKLDAEADQLILQVVDNGLGIPQTDQPYIFDKFYRASNIPDDTQGSGLGLAIVKSIVEKHQGRVWVNSQPGNGSCFTVVLPI